MYLSKKSLKELYSKMASLYSGTDIESQGGTQFVSEVKYFLATDEFQKSTEHACNTQEKIDKDFFVKCVGNVVQISNPISSYSLDTKNFSQSIGQSKDFDVGSNFFSANAVKNSIMSIKPIDFPTRHPRLLICDKGTVCVADDAYVHFANEDAYLGRNSLKYALLFLWLNRYTNFNSADSIYTEFLTALQNRYSETLCQSLQWSTSLVQQYFEKLIKDFTFDNVCCYLEMKDVVDDEFTRALKHLDSFLNDYVNKVKMKSFLQERGFFEEIQKEKIEPAADGKNTSKHSVEEREKEFGDFLRNIAKKRNGQSLAEKTIANYLIYLPRIVSFIKSIHVENIYEISSVDAILQIQEELNENEEYKEANRNSPVNRHYSSSLDQYKKFLIYSKEKDIDLSESEEDESLELPPLDPPTQIIYYGVPGCGKSNKIKEDLKDVPEYNKIRVVFHPEYTNADFMGQILPVVNGGISYKFTPGPFAQIIKRAYLNPNDKFYLVIEEINRGNAAAIFGDTFQLLDRLKPGKTDSLGNDPASPNVNTFTEGWSQYFVQNIDVNDYIRNVVEDNGKYKEPSDLSNTSRLNIKIGSITFTKNTAIRLPPNLSILATMNTSDQNVFTLDNAFQRRFDMQLVRNEFEKDESQNQFGGYKDADVQKQHDATIAGTNVKWGDFWAWINNKIVTTLKGLSSTEDKRLGVWFVSNVDGKIDEKVFAEKVLKYLWDDAFKFKRPQIFAPEIDTLERLIAAFEKPDSGKNRFEVFKDFSNLMSSVAAPPQNNGAANS